jgi:glucans biosynthesis protein
MYRDPGAAHFMIGLTRRRLLRALGALSLGGVAPFRSASAQGVPAPGGDKQKFGFEDVMKRAREVSAAPFDGAIAPLPPDLAALDFDRWRQIRFRPDKALLGDTGGKFRLQLFHLGHLFHRAISINLVNNGVAEPLKNVAQLFDYGNIKFPKPLPADLGVAGFRVHYPLNDPRRDDEFFSFLGASYFRWLGRDEKYGLSARGLSIGTGLLDNKEEFPFFREFWIEKPGANATSITVSALLDSPSLTGAYRFNFQPGPESPVDIDVTLYPRKTTARIGLAPLTSMYFLGENDRHLNDRNKYDEFRPELHDSDGLLIHTNEGEWIWRPLHNPLVQEVHNFPVNNVRGFGLMQRDRQFAHYQDIELNYEERPSYWIEPEDDWGEGRIELVELATKDETFDNIIVAFVPNEAAEVRKPYSFGYRMRAMKDGLSLHKLGYTLNTFSAPAYALGAGETAAHNTRRFMVDFTGGDLAFHLLKASAVQIATAAVNGKVYRQFLVPNPAINGFRVMLDVEVHPTEVTNVTCKLMLGNKALTETWAYSWKVYNF